MLYWWCKKETAVKVKGDLHHPQRISLLCKEQVLTKYRSVDQGYTGRGSRERTRRLL
jgi:hypothetical protein